MSIVTFKSRRARHVRGTRVEIGDTLYAVKKGHLFFIWCYTDRAMAEYVNGIAEPGQHPNCDRQTDIAANWRLSTDELMASDRKLSKGAK